MLSAKLTEIKKCPCCGSNASLVGASDDGRYFGTPGAVVRGMPLSSHVVLCGGCHLQTMPYRHASRAIAAWNRRVKVDGVEAAGAPVETPKPAKQVKEVKRKPYAIEASDIMVSKLPGPVGPRKRYAFLDDRNGKRLATMTLTPERLVVEMECGKTCTLCKATSEDGHSYFTKDGEDLQITNVIDRIVAYLTMKES